jgi:hypothetical protein
MRKKRLKFLFVGGAVFSVAAWFVAWKISLITRQLEFTHGRERMVTYTPPTTIDSLFEFFFDSSGTRTILSAHGIDPESFEKLCHVSTAEVEELWFDKIKTGQIDHLANFPRLHRLQVRDCSLLSHRDFSRLSHLKSIRELSLGSTYGGYTWQLTNEWVSETPSLNENIIGITDCTQLQKLTLWNIPISTFNLLNLGNSQNLLHLSIGSLTFAHTVPHGSFFPPPNLESFSIWQSEVSREHLPFLSTFTRLKRLHFFECPEVDDSLFDQLPDCNLQSLEILGTTEMDISELSLVKLSKYRDSLKDLVLIGTKVQRFPMELLQELSHLQRLTLGPRFSNAEAVALEFPALELRRIGENWALGSEGIQNVDPAPWIHPMLRQSENE